MDLYFFRPVLVTFLDVDILFAFIVLSMKQILLLAVESAPSYSNCVNVLVLAVLLQPLLGIMHLRMLSYVCLTLSPSSVMIVCLFLLHFRPVPSLPGARPPALGGGICGVIWGTYVCVDQQHTPILSPLGAEGCDQDGKGFSRFFFSSRE